jgi:Polyketide cyclase / dehydrase and lipid transport
MRTFDVQGIEIEAEPTRVFAFISDPRNLPRWARAFRAADQERATLETPRGAVDIALRTRACRDAGSVDWELQFPDGTIGLAQSRVTPTTRGTCIYSFVLHAPPGPLEQLEGALAQQSVTLREELATLKGLMESR